MTTDNFVRPLGTDDVRRAMAIPHLEGAARFAQQAYKLQQEINASDGCPTTTLRPLVSAAILLSAAAAEARFNELTEDQNTPKWFMRLINRGNLSERVNNYLRFQECEPIDKSKGVAQSFDTLMEVRDGLMHFKPEWESDQRHYRNLSKRLRAEITPSPFVREVPSQFFPVCIWHYGCAAWAVRASQAYIIEFGRAAQSDKTQIFQGERFRTEPE